MKQGGSPDEARLEQTPYPFQPTNLALFRHKITLYRFNQGGGLILLQGGLKWEQGAEPTRAPLTLTTVNATFREVTEDLYGGDLTNESANQSK